MPSRLARDLGPVMATAIVVGTVIGSGIYQKPQQVAANSHFFGLTALVWILGGVLALLGALAYAEVATLFPRAGGNYVFLREAYGPMTGFIWGWVEFFIIRGASLAALATLFSMSLSEGLKGIPGGRALGYWEQRAVTIAVLIGLALVNVRGVRWGGLLNLLITTVKVASLVFIIALPFVVLFAPFPQTIATPDPANLTPVWPQWKDLSMSMVGGFGVAMLAVLWAYHGWMNIATVAEEIKGPQRNIPLALILGVGILIALYLGANVAYSLVLPREKMAQMKERPASEQQDSETTVNEIEDDQDQTVASGFAKKLIGPAGVGILAVAVMCSVFGAINGNLLCGPRLLYAMGEDGLAPRILGEVHANWRTPVVAILIMAGWSSIMVLGVAGLTFTGLLPADQDHFNALTNFAMFGAVIFETMAVLSIFVFRRRLPDAPRPYRCWGYPVVPALYAILPAFVLANMFYYKWRVTLAGVGFIAAGAVVYAGYWVVRGRGSQLSRDR